VVQTGQGACVPLNLQVSVPVTNLNFVLVSGANRFTNWSISPTNSAVGSLSVQELDSAHVLFSLVARSGQVLPTQGPVASLCFSALPGTSGFLPLTPSNIAGAKLDGTLFSNTFSEPGRVTVISAQPLLEAALATNHALLLTLYGNPGASYEVDFATNLSKPQWQFGWRTPMTNLNEVFLAEALLPQVFYRAFEFTANPPLLQAQPTPSGEIQSLLLYGAPGSAYALQYTTNVLSGWRTLYLLPLTNSFAWLDALDSTGRDVYYRVELVRADPPILQASLSGNSLSLLAYGLANTNYTLQYSTDLPPSAWHPLLQYTLTNSFQWFNGVGKTNPIEFYRIQRH